VPIRKSSTKPKKVVRRAAPEATLLTLDEAALELRSCRKSLENWALKGELRLTRLGRKVLVPRSELEKFVRSKTER